MSSDDHSIWRVTRRKPFRAPPLSSAVEARVVIVGAGISGLSTALVCAEAGHSVLVIDADDVGAGTTGASSAHLTTLPDSRMATLESRFDQTTARAVGEASKRAIDQIEPLDRHV